MAPLVPPSVLRDAQEVRAVPARERTEVGREAAVRREGVEQRAAGLVVREQQVGEHAEQHDAQPRERRGRRHRRRHARRNPAWAERRRAATEPALPGPRGADI